MTKNDFLELLPAIREAAKKLGYAVGLHGSLARDYDLIAVPWVKDAADPDDLATAIKHAAGCVQCRVFRDQGTEKPHGRLVYCYDWDHDNHENRDYIDLSVMPRMESD